MVWQTVSVYEDMTRQSGQYWFNLAWFLTFFCLPALGANKIENQAAWKHLTLLLTNLFFYFSADDFTLEKIIELGLDQFAEQISEVSGAASKELSIEQVCHP